MAPSKWEHLVLILLFFLFLFQLSLKVQVSKFQKYCSIFHSFKISQIIFYILSSKYKYLCTIIFYI